MNRARAVLLSVCCGCALALPITVAFAGNGLNDFAYGTDSASVAGAYLAVARDTAALNTNPAGLTQIDDHALNILLEPYSYLDHQYHRDSVGNDVNANNKYGSLIAGGYGQRLSNDVVAAVGLFAQGGAGYVYKNLQTPFDTRDDYSATFGSLKIAGGLGWTVSDQLSLGMALGLVYSVARQKVFPETSTDQFSGVRLDGLGGLSAGVRMGLQYRPDRDWVLALVYGSKTALRLEDGTFTVNTPARAAAWFATAKRD